MTPVMLITGGAASGKSRYACEQAARHGKHVLFVATCIPRDEEMKAKVRRHQTERPATWHTVERAENIGSVLKVKHDAAIVDCLTLFVSQMLVDGKVESDILAEVNGIFEKPACPLFVVTNEVGCGLVPENQLGRRFREIAGRANFMAAQRADEVILMVSGIPVRVKAKETRCKN